MNCKAVNAPTTTFLSYLQTILIFVKTSRFILFVDSGIPSLYIQSFTNWSKNN